MWTADIGVEAFDLVHQSLFDEEIERTIDGGRLCGPSVHAELIHEIVSLHRTMARPDEFEDPAPQCRELRSALAADPARGFEGVGDARTVIMQFVRPDRAVAVRSMPLHLCPPNCDFGGYHVTSIGLRTKGTPRISGAGRLLEIVVAIPCPDDAFDASTMAKHVDDEHDAR